MWYPHENYIPVNLHLLASTLLDAVVRGVDSVSHLVPCLVCTARACRVVCGCSDFYAHADSHQSKIEEETGGRGLRQSFEELCGVYLYVVQAKHEALTRELQLYQTLFNPALRQVTPRLRPSCRTLTQHTRTHMYDTPHTHV